MRSAQSGGRGRHGWKPPHGMVTEMQGVWREGPMTNLQGEEGRRATPTVLLLDPGWSA